MSKTLAIEIQKIQGNMGQTLQIVKHHLGDLAQATEDNDAEKLKLLAQKDKAVDQAVSENTQRVLTCIALHQPVATQMRTLAACIYQLRALERMGDQISNICKTYGAGLETGWPPEFMQNLFAQMNTACEQQLTQAHHAINLYDSSLAANIRVQDHKIDFLQRDVFEESAFYAQKHNQSIRWAMYGVLVARAYERIGDLCVHFGDQIFYALEGNLPKKA